MCGEWRGGARNYVRRVRARTFVATAALATWPKSSSRSGRVSADPSPSSSEHVARRHRPPAGAVQPRKRPPPRARGRRRRLLVRAARSFGRGAHARRPARRGARSAGRRGDCPTRRRPVRDLHRGRARGGALRGGGHPDSGRCGRVRDDRPLRRCAGADPRCSGERCAADRACSVRADAASAAPRARGPRGRRAGPARSVRRHRHPRRLGRGAHDAGAPWPSASTLRPSSTSRSSAPPRSRSPGCARTKAGA